MFGRDSAYYAAIFVGVLKLRHVEIIPARLSIRSMSRARGTIYFLGAPYTGGPSGVMKP